MREERALISVHEAGHAVVALLLGYRVVYVSLAGGGGHTRYRVGDRRAPRHMSKGQQAMAVAMIYPEPEKGGRGKVSTTRRTRLLSGSNGSPLRNGGDWHGALLPGNRRERDGSLSHRRLGQ